MVVLQKIFDFIKKIDFKTLLILVLIIVILLMRACSGGKIDDNNEETIKVNGKKYVVVKRELDTIYKKITQRVYKPGKTIYVEKPIYTPVPVNVDTSKILKDYFAKNIYKDTLKLKDSLGYIALTDTIFKNNILGRTWESNINKVTVKETLYLKNPKKIQLFVGGVVGFDKNNIVNFAGPSVLLKDKKDHVYTLGVGYNNTKTVAIQGGMYWLIKLNKK
jgi:hypothetical protein